MAMNPGISYQSPVSANIERILTNLNKEQLEAVTAKEHPLIIIAGAGSGKTRVLTRRIAHRILTGDADARHTLAVTFTKKAANELKQRLRAFQMRDEIDAYTFHAAALRILQRYWESKGQLPFDLVESKFRIVSEAMASVGTTARSHARPLRRFEAGAAENELNRRSVISAVTAEIEWAKARGINPDGYPDAAVGSNRITPLTASEIRDIFRSYEAIKVRLRKIDYDDLIIWATHALTSDQQFAATERYRMRHLYIDEFQDINPVQMSLVNALLGGRQDLCVVGDPNQAIYSWNGAEPKLIATLAAKYPTSKTIALAQNYRSTPQILALAGTLLKGQNLLGENATELVANLPDGPIPSIRTFGDDRAETNTVAVRAKLAHQPGTTWADIAILARTNAQLIPFQTKLKELGVPVFLAGESNYLSQSEVRAILTILERDNSSVRGSSLYSRLEATVEAALRNLPETSPAYQNLNLFLELSHEHLASSPESDALALAQWLRIEAQNAKADINRDAVSLSTFHKAKGLEWKTVFIVGMEDGLVPIARAESRAALQEEQRLLYVAITRAQRDLHLSWAKQRSFGDHQLHRDPSPYLAKLQDEIAVLSGQIATNEQALTAIRSARRKLQLSGTPLTDQQQAVMTSLRLWRSKKSKELGVPAHLILHDNSLRMVATHLPSTVEALAKIAGIGSAKASKFGADLLRCISS